MLLEHSALAVAALGAMQDRGGGFIPEHPAFIAALIAVLLLALSWHEAAHAWVADKLGDPTARELGRVTLNPLPHLDPFLSVLLPVTLILIGANFILGGGKPVPLNPANFRHKARGFMLVALAGPFSNLLLAAAFGMAWIVSMRAGLLPAGPVVANPFGLDRVFAPNVAYDPTFYAGLPLWQNLLRYGLQVGVLINVILAIFNLMPIPPLDGSRLVGWLLPGPLRAAWYRLDRIGLILVVVLLFLLGGIEYVAYVLMRIYGATVQVINQLAAPGITL